MILDTRTKGRVSTGLGLAVDSLPHYDDLEFGHFILVSAVGVLAQGHTARGGGEPIVGSTSDSGLRHGHVRRANLPVSLRASMERVTSSGWQNAGEKTCGTKLAYQPYQIWLPRSEEPNDMQWHGD